MAIYNLEEDPNLFITPHFYTDIFHYRIEHIVTAENRTTKKNIDLESDKLMVFGTEIEKSMLPKLHDSLVLKPRAGIIYVNCNGTCYFVVSGKGCFGPINNVIFDWSVFGVTVPNSLNDSLKKQLSSVEGDLSTCRADFEASKKEIEEHKLQIVARQKDKQDLEENLHKVCSKLSVIDFELEIYKLELESSKKEATELKHRLSICSEDNEDMEIKLEELRHQLSLVNAELETSKKRVTDLEDELSSCRLESGNIEVELKKIQDQYSVATSELQQLKDQFSNAQDELHSTKLQLELSKNQVNEHNTKEAELKKTIDNLWSINSQKNSNIKKLDQVLSSMIETRVGHRNKGRFWARRQPLIIDTPPSQEVKEGDALFALQEFDASCTVPIIHDVKDTVNDSPVFIVIEDDVCS